ncbi:hypothetical protein BDV40DRAFT_269911 [Aspergillus tamarii]|uniref:Uncharacterized protein n=1 Tax=Aspergillus tamarii TaxID=41984 RepID=A0A5N6UPN7_ASPTM|nr:hypothetical protein BDV40DRAFT_269911 [Aspergillus tamarii]
MVHVCSVTPLLAHLGMNAASLAQLRLAMGYYAEDSRSGRLIPREDCVYPIQLHSIFRPSLSLSCFLFIFFLLV